MSVRRASTRITDSQSSSVRTIQRGLALANAINATNVASRVVIAAGVYRESILPDAGKKTDAATVIEDAGSSSTILTGADAWPTGWVAKSDGSLTHDWPSKWGMKPIPAGWRTTGPGAVSVISVTRSDAPKPSISTASRCGACFLFPNWWPAPSMSMRMPQPAVCSPPERADVDVIDRSRHAAHTVALQWPS